MTGRPRDLFYEASPQGPNGGLGLFTAGRGPGFAGLADSRAPRAVVHDADEGVNYALSACGSFIRSGNRLINLDDAAADAAGYRAHALRLRNKGYDAAACAPLSLADQIDWLLQMAAVLREARSE